MPRQNLKYGYSGGRLRGTVGLWPARPEHREACSMQFFPRFEGRCSACGPMTRIAQYFPNGSQGYVLLGSCGPGIFPRSNVPAKRAASSGRKRVRGFPQRIIIPVSKGRKTVLFPRPSFSSRPFESFSQGGVVPRSFLNDKPAQRLPVGPAWPRRGRPGEKNKLGRRWRLKNNKQTLTGQQRQALQEFRWGDETNPEGSGLGSDSGRRQPKELKPWGPGQLEDLDGEPTGRGEFLPMQNGRFGEMRAGAQKIPSTDFDTKYFGGGV